MFTRLLNKNCNQDDLNSIYSEIRLKEEELRNSKTHSPLENLINLKDVPLKKITKLRKHYYEHYQSLDKSNVVLDTRYDMINKEINGMTNEKFNEKVIDNREFIIDECLDNEEEMKERYDVEFNNLFLYAGSGQGKQYME